MHVLGDEDRVFAFNLFAPPSLAVRKQERERVWTASGLKLALEAAATRPGIVISAAFHQLFGLRPGKPLPVSCRVVGKPTNYPSLGVKGKKTRNLQTSCLPSLVGCPADFVHPGLLGRHPTALSDPPFPLAGVTGYRLATLPRIVTLKIEKHSHCVGPDG